ncbi:MAG: DUF2141 domain-containing protein [Bacteroidota bacterium]|nr:DUF2141 domain-containing protein [Bacteroidota bacterium]
MKFFKPACIVLSLLFIVNIGIAQNSIEVNVQNLRNKKGVIRVSLYNTCQSFPKVGLEYLKVSLNPEHPNYVFRKLPPGKYAVAVLHDENKNRHADKNWLGIPQDGFGFSRNVKPKVKAPSFEQTCVELKKGNILRLNIRLIYM